MSEPSSENVSRKEMKRRRLEYPSGWLYLCQHASGHLVIDALLSVDPRKEFTKTELAEFAGVSPQSVRRHIDTLVEVGVVAETANGKRYHYDAESPVGQLVAKLNAELVAASQARAPGEPPVPPSTD